MRSYGDDGLRQVLAELEVSAPVPPTPELQSQPSLGRWRLAFAAVVIPLALLAGYALFGLVDRPSVGESTPTPSPAASPPPSAQPSRLATPSPEPSTVEPSASEAPSPSPTPMPTSQDLSGWRTAGFGGPGSIEHAADIAPWASGFVSVGTHYGASRMPSSEPPPDHEGRIWLSPDGSFWEETTPTGVFDDVELGQVFVLPDETIVAIGTTVDPDTTRDVSRAWESSDARTWRETSLDGIGTDAHILDVEAGARGYLAAVVSGSGRAPSIWHSTDGRTWDLTREEVVANSEASDEGVLSIAAGDEGFVVVVARDHVARGREVSAIASADGRSWIVGDTPPAFFAGVAPIGPDWLLLAWDQPVPEAAATTFRTWRSTDGLAWVQSDDLTVQPIAIDDFTCSRSDPRLSAVGDVVIASMVAAHPCGQDGVIQPASAWVYVDGIGWDQLPVEQRAMVASVSARNRLLILAGYIDRDEAWATFWVGVPE